MKFIKESYLDDKEEYFDYNTKPIVKWIIKNQLPLSSEIFDKTTLGGFAKYDKYMSNNKNIQMITPNEYFEKAAEGFQIPVSQLEQKIADDKETLNHLHNVIFKYNRSFPLPYINRIRGNEQEGLHRIYLFAELYGWNKSFPCLIIDE